jgi:hypothetical protein
MKKSPINKKSYWNLVNQYWDDGISDIINLYLPTFFNKWIDGTPLDKPLIEYIIELKETKNPRIARVFNAAYYYCPSERMGEAFHKNWNIFYMLCSEEWCLIEEKEETEV